MSAQSDDLTPFDPLRTAVNVLAELNVEETGDAIWRRLNADVRAFGLPPMHPQEERIDIFVQVYEYGNNGEVARRLARACAQLLHRESTVDSSPNQFWRYAIAELSYFSARIEARDAIPSLLRLAGREGASVLLDHGETFRVRVIGSLVGLLGVTNSVAQKHLRQIEVVLQKSMREPGCELAALTGLVGMWPERRIEFLQRLPPGFQLNEQELSVNLAVAGFIPVESVVSASKSTIVIPKRESKRGFAGEFRVHVFAASGFLTRLDGQPVTPAGAATVHGESTVPAIGGLSRAVVDRPLLSFRPWIDYGRCETFASTGGEVNSQASVSDIRLLTRPTQADSQPDVRAIVFLADRLSLEMSLGSRNDQVSFRTRADAIGMALRFQSADRDRVVPLRLEFDPVIRDSTVPELDRRFQTDRDFFGRLASQLEGSSKPGFGQSLPRDSTGHITTSIVRAIFRGEQRIEGHKLVEPGFGTLRFGVLRATEFSREITLLRADMGSDPEGHASFAGLDVSWR